VYWVNSINENIIEPSKWTFSPQFQLINPALRGKGCVSAEIYLSNKEVKTRLRKHSSCGTAAKVNNFLCEKADPNDAGIVFYITYILL